MSPKNCSFLKEDIDSLSMLIGKNGTEVSPEKVKFLQNWPEPKSVPEVRSYLGLLQFF